MKELVYTVPGMSCEHCIAAVRGQLERISGVETIEADLATKRVVVRGEGLQDAALRAAIDEAGYEAA